jgi:predicted phage terminase large subunit-like protein
MNRPVITHVSQLEEHSSWRKYQRGLHELLVMEAPKSIIHEYKNRAARDCFLAFADLMKGGDLSVAPFHEIIGSAFEDLATKKNRRLIVSCPPRSGKSMLATMFVAWLLGRDQKTQHVIASYGQQLSGKFHREVITMMKSPVYKKIFPEFLGFSPDSKYDMLGGGYILATSVGGVLTGFTAGTTDMQSPGVGAMVIDDPLKSSDSKAALETLESWWQEQASTRRTNHWCQMVIATRFHERDLHGVLMEGDGLYDEEDNPFGWRWINIAGLCEDPFDDPLGRQQGESHWPQNSAFTVDMLLSQKRAMGSFKFAALYQGVPKSDEGQIIRPGWLKVVEEAECPDFDVSWLAVDCAFGEDEMADETAIAVCSVNKDDPQNVYVREIITGRWGFPDLIAAVKHLYKFYKARVLCIEKAASGQSLIQVLRREAKIPIEEFKPLKSKTTRLQAVSPLYEQGRVQFVEGPWVEPFVKELTQFPYVAHDDRTDSMVWALTYYITHLDAVDRQLSETILQHRRFTGVTRRNLIEDSGVFTTLNKSGQRALSADGWNVESGDAIETTRERLMRGARGRSRGVSWDS